MKIELIEIKDLSGSIFHRIVIDGIVEVSMLILSQNDRDMAKKMFDIAVKNQGQQTETVIETVEI